jgi:hypothetical protein
MLIILNQKCSLTNQGIPNDHEDLVANDDDSNNNATSPSDEEQHIITTTPAVPTTNNIDTTTNAHETYFMRDKRIIRRPSQYTEVIVVVLQQLRIIPTAMNLTIKQALKKFDKRARGAIQAELKQLLTKRVWNAIMRKKDASKSKHSILHVFEREV